MAFTVVAFLILDFRFLPFIVSCRSVFLSINCILVRVSFLIIRMAHITHFHIAGQCTQVVHRVVDAKVVTVL